MSWFGAGRFAVFGEKVPLWRRKYLLFLNARSVSVNRSVLRAASRSKRYAGPYYADLFGIAEDDLLYSVRRLNCINGSPVSIETALIPCLLFPTIEDIDVSVFSLYETYEMLGRKPVMAQEKLDIEALGARDAGLLALEQGDLVLLLECVSYDASGQAIEYVKSFNRGDTGGYTYTY